MEAAKAQAAELKELKKNEGPEQRTVPAQNPNEEMEVEKSGRRHYLGLE